MRITLLLALLVLALPVQAQFAITNHATLTVSVSGFDATAIRGRSDRPWRSVSNAIWAAQPGDRVLILPGSYTYSLMYTGTHTAAIKVWSKTNLLIEGSGWGTDLNGAGLGTHIQVSNCLNVIIRDFSMRGNKPATSMGAGLVNGPCAMVDLVGASQNIKCDGLIVKDFPNHGISCMDDTSSTPPNDIFVLNNNLQNGGATSGVPALTFDGPAIQITGQRWRVEGNTISNCVRGVEIYSNNYDLSNSVIRANYFLGMPFEGVTTVSASPRIIAGFLIQGNVFAGRIASPLTGAGIVLARHVRNCSIIGNRFSDQLDAIYMDPIGFNLSGNLISFNVIAGCTQYGIVMQDTGAIHTNAYSNQMLFNTISGCGFYGIRTGGNRTQIRGNTVLNCALGGIDSLASAGFGTNYNIVIDGNTTITGGTGVSVTGTQARTNRITNNQTVGADISNAGTGTITNGNWQ